MDNNSSQTLLTTFIELSSPKETEKRERGSEGGRERSTSCLFDCISAFQIVSWKVLMLHLLQISDYSAGASCRSNRSKADYKMVPGRG